MFRDIVNWWMKALGLVAVGEAVAYAELDHTLKALGVTDRERDQVLDMSALLAKGGFTTSDVTIALNHFARFGYTGGHLPNE